MMNILRKFVGFYYLVGAIALYLFYIFSQAVGHVFAFFIPNIIATIVFGIYVYASYLYIKYPLNEYVINFFIIILIIQSLQIQIFGYTFRNLYFPNLSIMLDLNDLSKSFFHFTWLSLKVVNGYFRNTVNNLISINLLQLIVVFAMVFISNKKHDRNLELEENVLLSN